MKFCVGLVFVGFLSSACSLPAESKPDGEGAIHAVAEELSTTETCDTGAPHFTITGSGEVRSGSGYNPSGCFRGYKVDINNYAPGPAGMLGGYSKPAPTDQTTCLATRFRAIVWQRNSNGTTTLLADSNMKRGTWVASPFGGMRCATPNADLTVLAGAALAPGGNYRVTMQAKIEGGLEGTDDDIYEPVYLGIAPKLIDFSAVNVVRNAANVRATFLKLPSSAVDPTVQTLWSMGGGQTRTSAMMCRSLELLVSLYQVNAVALKKLVATSSAALVDRRTQNAQNIRNLLCNNPFPSGSDINSLQGYVTDDLGWGTDMVTAMQSYLNVGKPEASELLVDSLRVTAQRLAARCGAVPSEIVDYINLARTPAGIAGANLLQRNCSGTAAQIAAASGIGVNTGGNMQTKLKACLDSVSAALSTDRCSGPISQAIPDTPSSPPSGSTPQPPPDCGTLVWNAADGICEPADANDEVRKVLIQENKAYEESTRRVEVAKQVMVAGLWATTATGFAASYWADFKQTAPEVPGGAAVLNTAMIVEAALTVAVGIYAVIDKISGERSLDQICLMTGKADPRCGGRPLNKCVEYDLQGDRTWFQTAASSAFPDGREATQQDLFQDCTCILYEKDYGQAPLNFQFGGPVSWCSQTAGERKLAECLRNPETTTDAPKKDCVDLMQPKEVDRGTMTARWCHDKMPNCTGAYLQDTGVCGCPGGTSTSPAVGVASCPTTDCSPNGFLNEKTCLCTDYDSGLGCAKGGMAGYLTKSPNDLFAAVFPRETALGGRNFLMVAAGNTPIVTPEVKRAGLKNLRQLTLTTRLPTTTLSSGYQGWAAQISCTNKGANVQNRSLRTVQFQNASAGLNTASFAITAADATACFNNDASAARFEIRTNNPVGQSRIGVEDFVVTNSLIDRTGLFLPDPCNVPTIINEPPIPRPDPIPFTTIFTLPAGWTLSDGTLILGDVVRR